MGKRMVRWLNPLGLVVVGVEATLSGIFGQYADRRELEASSPNPQPLSFSAKSEVWVDYIADTGDGWNSTASIAWAACRDWHIGDTDTTRGDILVLGGDEVYPSANKDRYETRLKAPFQAASNDSVPPPNLPIVFALPGNHDWYDGLDGFARVFTEPARFAGWFAPQARSYFAAALPHRWWLVGIDLALDRYLDDVQLHYFRGLQGGPDGIQPGDRIILCTSRPAWAYRELRGERRSKNREVMWTALQEFEHEITERWGCELPVVLSGDLHHYSHYWSPKTRQHRLTVGGGGAFLYPTHGLADCTSVGPAGDELVLRTCYPDKSTSRGLRWWIPLGPFTNLGFVIMVGTLYLVIALQARGGLQGGGRSVVQTLLGVSPTDILTAMFTRPSAGGLCLLVLAGLIAFADVRWWWNRGIVGTVHWAVQMSAVALSILLAASLTGRLMGFSRDHVPSSSGRVVGAIAIFACVFVIGALAGPLLMGIYLFIAQLCRGHANEAYAALHLSRRKCFLRMRIDSEGTLTLYPLKVDRVCKNWDATAGGEVPLSAITPELIEAPILFPSGGAPDD